jgi:hypothetical protein
MYRRAIESGELNPPRMHMLALGGLAIFEKPKGTYGIDLSEDASVVLSYVENNLNKAIQATNVKIL